VLRQCAGHAAEEAYARTARSKGSRRGSSFTAATLKAATIRREGNSSGVTWPNRRQFGGTRGRRRSDAVKKNRTPPPYVFRDEETAACSAHRPQPLSETSRALGQTRCCSGVLRKGLMLSKH